MIGLIPRGGGIIWFVGVGLAGGQATFADTQDPPCADEYDPGKVWQVWLAGVAGWVCLAGRPATLADEQDPPLPNRAGAFVSLPGSLLRGAIPAGDSHL